MRMRKAAVTYEKFSTVKHSIVTIMFSGKVKAEGVNFTSADGLNTLFTEEKCTFFVNDMDPGLFLTLIILHKPVIVYGLNSQGDAISSLVSPSRDRIEHTKEMGMIVKSSSLHLSPPQIAPSS